jgi:hypothetical protein
MKRLIKTSNKELELISPSIFRDEFAPHMGLPSVRELFAREDFPGMKLGNRYCTTRKAAKTWLSSMGMNI